MNVRTSKFLLPLGNGVYGVSTLEEMEEQAFRMQEENRGNPRVRALVQNLGVIHQQLREELARQKAA